MENNVILEKSYSFALNALKAVKILNRTPENYVLVKQFIRAAASVGSNVEESQGGESKKDFIHKLNISYKEARECKFWIRLIRDSQLTCKNDIDMYNKLFDDADELCKILYKIIESSK
jgi:four helix bundle protein